MQYLAATSKMTEFSLISNNKKNSCTDLIDSVDHPLLFYFRGTHLTSASKVFTFHLTSVTLKYVLHTHFTDAETDVHSLHSQS